MHPPFSWCAPHRCLVCLPSWATASCRSPISYNCLSKCFPYRWGCMRYRLTMEKSSPSGLTMIVAICSKYTKKERIPLFGGRKNSRNFHDLSRLAHQPSKALGCPLVGMLEMIAFIPFQDGVKTLGGEQFILPADAVAHLCHHRISCFFFFVA